MPSTNNQLVDDLVHVGILKTPSLIRSFRQVDRRLFVLQPEEAYQDYALPLFRGQTISQPSMIAIMLELLELKRTDTILEVGAGSGYNAALMGRMAKKVYSLDIDKVLVTLARKNLKKAGIKNVSVLQGDGSRGLPEKAPFDKIVFSCAVRKIPLPVIGQLKDPGILEAPVGGRWHQELIVLRKQKGKITTEAHGGCVFVPLRKGSSKDI